MPDDKSEPGKYDLNDTDKMTLAERIAERHRTGISPPKKGVLRAQFQALHDEIEAAFAQGWGANTIHETLHAEKRFKGGYGAFCQLCREYGLGPNRAPSKRTEQPAKRATAKTKSTPKTKSSTTQGGAYRPERIKHDPDDLV